MTLRVAVHESVVGTKQTSRHVRSNAANGVEADIIGSL